MTLDIFQILKRILVELSPFIVALTHCLFYLYKFDTLENLITDEIQFSETLYIKGILGAVSELICQYINCITNIDIIIFNLYPVDFLKWTFPPITCGIFGSFYI